MRVIGIPAIIGGTLDIIGQDIIIGIPEPIGALRHI